MVSSRDGQLLPELALEPVPWPGGRSAKGDSWGNPCLPFVQSPHAEPQERPSAASAPESHLQTHVQPPPRANQRSKTKGPPLPGSQSPGQKGTGRGHLCRTHQAGCLPWNAALCLCRPPCGPDSRGACLVTRLGTEEGVSCSHPATLGLTGPSVSSVSERKLLLGLWGPEGFPESRGRAQWAA